MTDAGSGETFTTHDPATGEAHGPRGAAEDIDRAAFAARRAFDTTDWARWRPARARTPWRISELILSRADDFAELESLDNGNRWESPQRSTSGRC